MESFFNYRRFRYLWVNFFVLAASSVWYCLDRPAGGRNGGTVLGYTLGVLSALGILVLMWYGIRKRRYKNPRIPLKGWLAFHIWLGISLLLLVPLHCAFRFGINVHTLAYVLMAVTIISGIWGAINFSRLAPEVRSHRGGGTLEVLLKQAESITSEVGNLVKGKSDKLLGLANMFDHEFKPSILGGTIPDIDRPKAASVVAELPKDEREIGLKLISLLTKKRELFQQIYDESRVKFWLRVWLYVHLPISLALVTALIIHIVTVFYYF